MSERKFEIGDRVSFELQTTRYFGEITGGYRNCGEPHDLPTYSVKLERNGSSWEMCESVLTKEEPI